MVNKILVALIVLAVASLGYVLYTPNGVMLKTSVLSASDSDQKVASNISVEEYPYYLNEETGELLER